MQDRQIVTVNSHFTKTYAGPAEIWVTAFSCKLHLSATTLKMFKSKNIKTTKYGLKSNCFAKLKLSLDRILVLPVRRCQTSNIHHQNIQNQQKNFKTVKLDWHIIVEYIPYHTAGLDLASF